MLAEAMTLVATVAATEMQPTVFVVDNKILAIVDLGLHLLQADKQLNAATKPSNKVLWVKVATAALATAMAVVAVADITAAAAAATAAVAAAPATPVLN
jgi:hypothetical protein